MSSKIRTLITGGTGFLGTNLVDYLLTTGREVRLLARSRPSRMEHVPLHLPGDIMDPRRVAATIREFSPNEVVHLAAKTDFVTWDDPIGFQVNTEGTANVLSACADADTPRVLIASSHVVLRRDDNRAGIRHYAASKRAMEDIVQAWSRDSPCSTIIRPCSLWGPWLRAPYLGFFLSIARGRYMNFGRADPPKRVGFVGNTCLQIRRLLEAPERAVHQRIFYLADYETTTIRSWASAIAREMGRREPGRVPEPLVRAAARIGDILQGFGYREPPLTSFRLANMRTDTSTIPIDDIKALANRLPYSLEEGVRITVQWLRSAGLVR